MRREPFLFLQNKSIFWIKDQNLSQKLYQEQQPVLD